jgi:hypothetical protein
MSDIEMSKKFKNSKIYYDNKILLSYKAYGVCKKNVNSKRRIIRKIFIKWFHAGAQMVLEDL